MRERVSNRWFALAGLVLVLACGAFLYIQPKLGGWLVLLALLPWLVHLATGQLVLERTVFIYPLALFIVTTGIGVWAAYDRQSAWEKFWIILGAITIFIVLVSQPRANLGVVAGLVGIMGVIIAILFILNNDWNTQSSDLDVINRAGRWILSVRQSPGGLSLPPNFVGGTLAMLASIPFGIGFIYWKKCEIIKAFISWTMGSAIIIGLFLTSSRGAWLALFLAAFLWILWRASLFSSVRFGKSPTIILVTIILLILIPVLIFIVTSADGIVGLADRLPGLPSGESRLDLAVNTAKLIGDYPFTGGGLRSFPGLYSQYIRVTPYFLFSYSHNFYLDVFLEQGFLGGIALLVLISGSGLMLAKQVRDNREDSQIVLLSEAVLVSLMVLLLHGLVDDALYGDLGTPLLLFLPGIALMLVYYKQPVPQGMKKLAEKADGEIKLDNRRKKLIIPGILLVIILLAVFIVRGPLSASLLANLGAVEMSRVELKNWPLDKWNSNPDVTTLIEARNYYTKALVYNPNQRTALHRLGLIAMQARDFETAQTELKKAYIIDPAYRGIRKSLGYTYVWVGLFDEAKTALIGIQEAESEMGVYSWWWREQDREDLARQAEEMAKMLHNSNQGNCEMGDK